MKFAVIGDLHLTNNPESLTYKKILPFVLKKAEEARKKNQPLWQKIGPVAGAALAIFLL